MVALVAVAVGCSGGGGDDAAPVSTPPPTSEPPTTVALAPTTTGLPLVPTTVATVSTEVEDPTTSPGPTSEQVERFRTTPLCADPLPQLPSLQEGHVVVTALRIDESCLRAVAEAVDEAAAATRVEELRADPAVISASVDHSVEYLSTPPTPCPAAAGAQTTVAPGEQWALDQLDVRPLWDRTRGEAVTVGVIESLYDAGHSDLRPPTFVEQPDDEYSPCVGEAWHGTHVVGIVAGAGVEGGTSGVAPGAQLAFASGVDLDVDPPLTTQASATVALKLLVEHGAKIINLSFFIGAALTRDDVEDLEIAMQAAALDDVVIVMANGNCGPGGKRPCSTRTYPQLLKTLSDETWTQALMTVGSTDVDRKLDPSSTTEVPPTLSSPGLDIISTVPGGYARMSGTSMAAPFAAGVAALLRSAHPTLTAAQVVDTLRSTATKLDEAGTGAGLINPNAAMSRADGLSIADRDFLNVTLPVGTCVSGNWQSPYAIELHDGRGHAGQIGDQPDSYAEAYVSGDPSFADLDADGITDALLVVDCNAGGGLVNSHELFALPLRTDGSFLRLIGGSNIQAVSGDIATIDDVELDGAEIVVHERYAAKPGESGRMFLTGQAIVRWRWNGTAFEPTITTITPSADEACSAATIGADANVVFYSGPTCSAEGWALGITEDLSGTDMDVVFTEVFHRVDGTWRDLGQFYLYSLCDQGLLSSGMPRNVALELVPDDTCLVPESSSGDQPLHVGDTGDRVRQLQIALQSQVDPALEVDAEYGPATEAAVRVVQQRAQLDVDGVAGPKTFAALGLEYP